MGICLGKTTTSRSPWPDLPPDLAALIISRLPSHRDRLSFGAVFRDWRLAARQELPPAMPCISLGRGAYQSIADGKVFRSSHGADVTSFGSYLLYKHSRRLFLRDSSSTIEIPRDHHECADECSDRGAHDPCGSKRTWPLIPAEGVAFTMRKVLVCSSSLLVAILNRDAGRPVSAYCLVFFRPGTGQLSWVLLLTTNMYGYKHGYKYRDIALYRGKIFALISSEQLFTHEIEQPCRVQHVIKEHTPLPPGIGPSSPKFLVKYYIVVSSDNRKLLMVRWNIPHAAYVHHSKMNLQVFEADLEKRQWLEVNDLDGQLLFLSRTCSRALAGSSTEHYGQTFRGNRVFILGTDWARIRRRLNPCTCHDCEKLGNGVPSYCVYDMTSGKLSLVSLRRTRRRKNAGSEWFFPSG
ncbi:hypothetical protein CFC21_090672 [Triticum aestivum]|uniref:KIB1-4 beta-propeller domain-containing protein n=2 Tax=Triticum aestivum TaxID=4565 RepID=A0A3B6UCP9_WHEAT|nr:hypothetical protein CFC21_090672 [Triticum aestivum]